MDSHPSEHAERTGIRGGGTHRSLQAGDSLDVVVQHVGSSPEQHVERDVVTLGVGDQRFDTCGGAPITNRVDACSHVCHPAVGEIVAEFDLSQPTISRHLSVLKEADLVREQRRGTRRFYEVDPNGLDPLRTYLEDFWGGVLAAFKTVADQSQGGTHNG